MCCCAARANEQGEGLPPGAPCGVACGQALQPCGLTGGLPTGSRLRRACTPFLIEKFPGISKPKSTTIRAHSRAHSPGCASTYLSGNAVQTNRATSLAARLKNPAERIKLTKALEFEFYRALEDHLLTPNQSRYSFPRDTAMAKLRASWRPGITMLVDAPSRAIDETTKSTVSVPDFKRKYLRSGQSDDDSTAGANLNIQQQLKDSAFFRVFVKEDVHDLILSHLTEQERETALRSALSLS